MKRIYIIYFIWLITSMPLWALPIKKGEVEIRDLNVVRNEKTLLVNMGVDISKLNVKSDETVVLTPVVKKGECEVLLPSIEVMGRRAYLHYQRNGKRTVTPSPFYAERVAKRSELKKGEKQDIQYETNVQFEEWMRGATISIYEGNCACNPVQVQLSENELGRFLPELYKPTYRISFVEPDPEPVKVRNMSLTAYINFYLNKYDIVKNFKNNATELDSVISSVARVDNDDDLTITSISIEGWASPEATEEHNKLLSQNRANSLADYIAKNTGIDRSLIQAVGRGEDWDGFKKAINSDTEFKDHDKILAIIDDSDLTLDQKDQMLASMTPATIYQRLLHEFYPRLRRNDYRIVYNIRNYNLEEARVLVDSNPRKLSVNELYKVAGTYPKDSEQYKHVMSVAAQTYPSTVPVAVNYAAILLSEHKYDAALNILSQCDQDDARVLLIRGNIQMETGNIEDARKFWQKSANLGNADAKHNLSELEKYQNSL